MAGRRLGILTSGPALASIGVAAATLGVSDPSSRFAVAVLAALGIVVTTIIARFQKDPEAGRYLRDLMLLGVGVRLLAFALVHQSVGPYVFAPDQFTYEGWGRALAAYFTGQGPFPHRLSDTLQIGYPVLNGVIYLIFGPAKAAPAVLNMFFSVWTAVPIYHLAMHLVRRNRDVARWSAGLTVFFPSLVLWSILNVREAPTILTVVLVVYFIVRMQMQFDLASLAGTVSSLVVLTLMREYLTSLVGVAGAAGILMGRSRSPVRSLIVGSTMLVAVTFTMQSIGLGSSLGTEPTLERVQMLRQDFQFGARSAYGQGIDVSNPVTAILYLPLGLAYFLLAPFPWAISSALQAITFPEIILWYLLVPFGLRGAWLALRHDARAYTVPLAILVVVTFAYALVESNVGTAYRHRAQVLPLMFIFCALGLRDYYAVRSARRAALGRQRERAAARGPDPVRRMMKP
ncbi:MAG: hypothetical protein ACE5GJ_03110 [Gemmatimonadota bacterium]